MPDSTLMTSHQRTPQLIAHLRARSADEDGSLITSWAVVILFLSFVLVTVQTATHLSAVSKTNAVAASAAARAARQELTCAQAEAWALDFLQWADMKASCTNNGTVTTMTISGPSPSATLRAFGTVVGAHTINQQAQIRTEQ